MHSRTRSITWQGEAFHFECLTSTGSHPPQWAVSHKREFIGMMPCPLEVTTKDFDVRCSRWLSELLGRTEAEIAKRRH